ncbi:MAG: lysophospholipid acyltransferase family protein [Chitinophagales bacterium]|nr:lysophospholipid acyltransferase family protein [Chitinophagales bacterium]
MQAIGYYISLPFLYLISILSSGILYGISDIAYFLLFHIVGYRKKVVLKNLQNSFPEKSDAELRQIMHGFYSYLCDLFVETVKAMTMSRKFLIDHCIFSPDAKALFIDYYEQQRSIIVVMGHFGNWEWAGVAFPLICKQQLQVIYHPLSNKYFNMLMIHIRTRFGNKLISMPDTFREMIRNRKDITATVFIADQTPSADNAYWTTFLNQQTPVFRGTETIARKLNYPVVFASVRKVRRGRYEIMAETLFEQPTQTTDGEITEAHTRQLEKEIREQPEIWLWSHRRWKHAQR